MPKLLGPQIIISSTEKGAALKMLLDGADRVVEAASDERNDVELQTAS